MRRDATPLLRRAGAAVALGCLLGLVDAALHVTMRDWSVDPTLAGQSLLRVIGVYGGLALAVSMVLGWRALRWSLVGGFTIVQVLAWYYHSNPQIERGAMLIALAVSAAPAVCFVWLASRVLGRAAPRWGLAASILASTGVVGCAAWLYPHADEASLNPSPPALVRSGARAGLPPDALNVLVITLDTLRADHVGAYGYTRVRTPHLDALAEEGVLFERAVIQAPLTPPSHASIFTGVYPARHGIRGFTGANHLAADRPTLAEILNESGYVTGAVVAAAPLAPGTGIERGFGTYDFSLRSKDYPFYGFRTTLLAKVLKRLQIVPDRTFYRDAHEQTDRALAWLDAHAGRPFFLWVHYFDVHDPYAPPFRHLRPASHPETSVVELLTRSYQYDSELAFLDEQIGRLVDGLRERGALGKTIIAGISDHGEGLGEHNYVGHSDRLFDEQLHAVFFLRAPGRTPAGRRIAEQVRGIDLMPTLLDLLALPSPEGTQGTSLLPLIAGTNAPASLFAFSESFIRPSRRLVSASDGRHKLILSLDRGNEWLFDVTADPAETRNLVSDLPQIAANLRNEIKAYVTEAPGQPEESVTLDPAVREQLRALGYIR